MAWHSQFSVTKILFLKVGPVESQVDRLLIWYQMDSLLVADLSLLAKLLSLGLV